MRNFEESRDLNVSDEKLVETALESRKFELEFLWQRSSFFWVFITAALAAFGATKDTYPSAALAISGFGFITSLSWTLINRGSKYWYESWEKKIENRSHKLKVLFKPEDTDQKGLLAGKRFSPSKLLVGVSDYATALWFCLLIYQISLPLKDILGENIWILMRDSLKVIFLILTILYGYYLWSRSYNGRLSYKLKLLPQKYLFLLLNLASISILIFVFYIQVNYSSLGENRTFLALELIAVALASIALALDTTRRVTLHTRNMKRLSRCENKLAKVKDRRRRRQD